MSDEKQPKAKRPVTPLQSSEMAVPMGTEPASSAEALPAPQPLVALPAPVTEVRRAADRGLSVYHATVAAIGESQAAIASDLTAMALEMSAVTRSNLTAAGDGLTAMLSARSFADLVEAQLGVARRSLNALAEGSARLGEIGRRLADDAAKPVTKAFATV